MNFNWICLRLIQDQFSRQRAKNLLNKHEPRAAMMGHFPSWNYHSLWKRILETIQKWTMKLIGIVNYTSIYNLSVFLSYIKNIKYSHYTNKLCFSIWCKKWKFGDVIHVQNKNMFSWAKLICCVENIERNMIRMFTYLHVLWT